MVKRRNQNQADDKARNRVEKLNRADLDEVLANEDGFDRLLAISDEEWAALQEEDDAEEALQEGEVLQ